MRRSAARLARFAEALALAPSSSRAGRDGLLVTPRPREWRREHRGRGVSSHATRSSPAPPTDLSENLSDVVSERPPDAEPRMRFASGLSKREDLSLAVVEAVAEVKKSLGHDAVPTFVQVMVSSAYADPSAAPAYVMECFTPEWTEQDTEPNDSGDGTTPARQNAQKKPALFGGVVTGAIGGVGAVVDGFGVSVFAGSMPNVEAVAFHVHDASLPSQLTLEQWRRIFDSACDDAEHRYPSDDDASARERDDEDEATMMLATGEKTKKSARRETGATGRKPRVAALMLACADFRDVETFTGRLHAAAPGAVVVGAVAKPGGALFSGSREITRVESRESRDEKAEDVPVRTAGSEKSFPRSSAEEDDDPFSFGDPFFFPRTGPTHLPQNSAARRPCASHGAVGVLLVGDFTMEAHSLHANRPAGPPMTLTRAGTDGVVLDLDGRAAGDALAKLLADLPEGVAGMPVMLGMRDEDDAFRATERTRSDVSGGKNDASRSRFRPTRTNARGGRSAWIRGRVVDQDDTSTSTALDDAREGTKKTPSDAFGATLKKNETEKEKEKTKQTPVISAAAAAAEARASRAYGEGGAGYVYRDIVGADHETGGVFVGSTHALREGSCVQLHVRDAAWGKERVKALLKRIADDRNPPAGAVMYTCVSGNRMHAGDFREAVGYCPLGGGFVAGEIAPSERGARAALQSHTSVVAVFRERDGAA